MKNNDNPDLKAMAEKAKAMKSTTQDRLAAAVSAPTEAFSNKSEPNETRPVVVVRKTKRKKKHFTTTLSPEIVDDLMAVSFGRYCDGTYIYQGDVITAAVLALKKAKIFPKEYASKEDYMEVVQSIMVTGKKAAQ